MLDRDVKELLAGLAAIILFAIAIVYWANKVDQFG